jgi:hypothetical protein
MHHKRKGPKSTRAGCLLCKPHKRQGAPLRSRQRHGVLKAMATLSGDRGTRDCKLEDPAR